MSPRRPRPAGATAADLAVGLGLAAAVFLVALMALPRNRERARLTSCQRNLGQIGLALALYDQLEGRLPAVGKLEAIDTAPIDAPPAPGPGPLRTLLDTLGLESFQGLKPASPLPRATGQVPEEASVPGFVCQSDPMATTGRFRAPISYRACTGGDALGDDGAFAPGRGTSLEKAEAADGASFTAAFSERKVGDGNARGGYEGNFAAVPGPIPAGGCPVPLPQGATWIGDAGASWVLAGYRSTLYNHAPAPNSPGSCVSRDGRTAGLGASSGHAQGVNLLMLDGSVKLVTPSVSPKVWKEFASLAEPEPTR
ncbi:hypothetical protein OJF2_17570 [Aquisphaera giovannonii]|uniref:DUF1559 domain-containing protein n=1 Tax=Aquisphaera giovannonii TaxID=406548 RepID=A0A5B9VZ65_9BACT|nr:DUF1559 domain-containing protein [Aquisphaera giovannonii]QEH33257.1 hypothetical protein OJF2_17570 [Aquisphaera giovannonii]